MTQKREAPPQRLVGWKAIAEYLGQPLAIAQHWAKTGMPVERAGRNVVADPERLQAWLGRESGVRKPVHIASAADEDLATELRRGLRAARTKR